jgi:uncharacterized phiE125 gp8 family phage protein
MRHRLITAPASEPVTAAEVKHDAAIDGSYSDAAITVFIKAARMEAEKRTGLALITQTWELVLAEFSDEIDLGKMPVSSVTSVTYYDTNGATQTVSSADYLLDKETLGSRITLAYGAAWPSTQARAGAVVIRFVCGYGAATDVPEDIKTWIRLQAAKLADKDQGQVIVSEFVDGLLDQHRISFV